MRLKKLCASILIAGMACTPLVARDSDEKAVRLASSVVEAMGGQAAWDGTRHIVWTFFGRRHHVWDKATGDVRIEGKDKDTERPYVILMNVNSKEGRAWKDGIEVTDAQARAEMLDLGEGVWINDSYWLVMPYKLRDPGVTLRYRGQRSMTDGRDAEVLELTFEEVGRTPENRYEIYVAKDSGLVEQWDYYGQASDEEPGLSTPWHGWQKKGAILLSGNRGKYELTNIEVHDDLPRSVYESPNPTGLFGD